MTGDDQLEVVYVNSTTGELSYVTLEKTIGTVTTDGSGITVDQSVGVA